MGLQSLYVARKVKRFASPGASKGRARKEAQQRDAILALLERLDTWAWSHKNKETK
jgi:hypothetical protein